MKIYTFVEVSLFHLFFLQVNAKNDWEELLENFGIPESTANGAILLKQTYLRYLDPYEKIYFLGEDDDDGAGRVTNSIIGFFTIKDRRKKVWVFY